MVVGGINLPPINQPFIWGKDGQLVHGAEGKNGENASVVISEHPIFLKSVQSAEIATDTYSYAFKHYLPQEGWKEIIISAGTLMGPAGTSEMFRRGAVIQDRDLFRRYVISSIDSYNKANRLTMRYEQFGWKDDNHAFLWGKRLYTSTSVKDVTGSDEVNIRAKELRPYPGGSLATWSALANTLFARDCEPQAFSLLCSFAAPLMRFHSSDEGGAIIALVGKKGTGKTTAFEAAGSVWGQFRGLEINVFDTPVSRGVKLGVLSNLPVIYDEIDKQDADLLKRFVAIFTNGRDRARGTVDGGIRHEARTWQTILLAGANDSVVELLQGRQDDNEALSSRVLELPAKLASTISTSGSEKLRDDLKLHGGYAGDAYLRYIMQPETLTWVRNALEIKTREMWERTALPHPYRFAVRTLSAVAVASEIVRKLDLLAFNQERIIDWTVSQLVNGGPKETPEVRGRKQAVSIISEYINDHVDCMLTMDKATWGRDRMMPVTRPPRRILIRYERDSGKFSIATKPLKEWLLRKQIPAKMLFDDLFKAGVFMRETGKNLSHGTDVPGGIIQCIEINGQHPAMSGVVTPVENLSRSGPSPASSVRASSPARQ